MENNRIKLRDFDGKSTTARGEYNAKLVYVGNNKIELIKLINEDTSLSLSQAKNIVDSCPAMIKINITMDEAQEIKSKLESAGAIVEIDKEGERCSVAVERTIEITRKRQLNGGGSKIKMYVDDDYYVDLYCGDTIKLKQNAGRFMSFCFEAGDGSHWSEKYAFPRDDTNHNYQLCTKSGLFSVSVLLKEI